MSGFAGVHSGLALSLTLLCMWSILAVTIPAVRAGRVDGALLASFALLALASFEAVTPLPQAAQMWAGTRRAARRLFEIVDAAPEVRDPEPASPPITNDALRFTNLTFSYPGQRSPALQDVSFSLEAGRSVAIVGPSGAGKSTLAALLLRFWEYESGEIHLGGRPLKEYAQDEVRARIGTVSHDPYFFHATVYENLRLARRGATREQVEAAARAAQVHDFIQGLARGYDTVIGERGQRLSGGERQRLALARAVLKDAPVLILDEPTANLDVLTEARVLDRLHEFAQGRTSLWITHRLVGMQRVDAILVLEHGRIVEQGTHASLLAAGGLYRRLWDLQNRARLGRPSSLQPTDNPA
jgi:ATP-binding cassette subfamily C protein CydC